MSEFKEDRTPLSATTERRQAAMEQVFRACTKRFRPPAFEVTTDDSGVVWVRTVQPPSRSVGLQPWLLRNRSVDELVARVASKLQPEAGDVS